MLCLALLVNLMRAGSNLSTSGSVWGGERWLRIDKSEDAGSDLEGENAFYNYFLSLEEILLLAAIKPPSWQVL